MTDHHPTLRFGVLGTGRMLDRYAEVFPLVRGVELAAVASRDPARAAARAAQHGISRVHASYAALVADPELDGVINALHNGLHAEWSIRALEAGKHVLCEKPLGCTALEVEGMLAAARAHDCQLMEALMYRFHPQLAEVQRLVTSGAIGRVLHVRSARVSRGREAGNPRYRADAGGGALLDIGYYCVDFARLVAGREPRRVAALARFGGEGDGGVDLTLAGTLEFDDALTAQFVCSFEGEPTHAAEVTGTAGRLLVPHPWLPPAWPAELLLTRHGRTETISIEPPGVPAQLALPFVRELEHFAACVRERRSSTVVTAADTLANARVTDALLAAARTGQPVAVARATAGG